MSPNLIAWAYCIIIIGALGIITNILQIVLAFIGRKKTSLYDTTLISLSVADIISGAMSVIYGCRKLLVQKGIHVDVLVLRYAWTGCYFSTASSFMHVIFIAVQRLCAVIYPTKFNKIFTKPHAVLAMVTIWVISAGFALLSEFEVIPLSSMEIVMLSYGAALVAMYTAICYQMWKRKKMPRGTNSRHMNRVVIMHSFVVMLIFVICVLPYAITRFFSKKSIFYAICDNLFALNPFFDSVIYFFINHFRKRKAAYKPSDEEKDEREGKRQETSSFNNSSNLALI